jgi:(p)ppGpp synthase/HD superfamily hydrolase
MTTNTKKTMNNINISHNTFTSSVDNNNNSNSNTSTHSTDPFDILVCDKTIALADEFQTWAHNSMARHEENRWRKYTHEPYSTHPRAVARMAASFGIAPIYVVAALLHDILEDTIITFQDLHKEFESSVTNFVLQVTESTTLADGNRATRKAIERVYLANACAAMQTVKVADLLHNSFSICRYDEKFKLVFLPEMKLLIDCLTQAHGGIRMVAYQFIEANL